MKYPLVILFCSLACVPAVLGDNPAAQNVGWFCLGFHASGLFGYFLLKVIDEE